MIRTVLVLFVLATSFALNDALSLPFGFGSCLEVPNIKSFDINKVILKQKHRHEL
jgi:hypothetical protein